MNTLSRLVLLCALPLFLLSGCENRYQPSPPVVPVRVGAATPESRFSVEKVATFTDHGAYHNERSIFILVDHKTGQEFVGISGVGISELGSHTEPKNRTVTDER